MVALCVVRFLVVAVGANGSKFGLVEHAGWRMHHHAHPCFREQPIMAASTYLAVETD